MDITRLCAAAVILCAVLLAVILVIQKYFQAAED
jgi:ABC-type glycerol-3-phosphate transport system permease component